MEIAPVGPTSEEEAIFLAEERIEAPAPVPASSTIAETNNQESAAPLPELDELVNRIPAPARAILEELFRAQFVTVKRIPSAALKG